MPKQTIRQSITSGIGIINEDGTIDIVSEGAADPELVKYTLSQAEQRGIGIINEDGTIAVRVAA